MGIIPLVILTRGFKEFWAAQLYLMGTIFWGKKGGGITGRGEYLCKKGNNLGKIFKRGGPHNRVGGGTILKGGGPSILLLVGCCLFKERVTTR